MSTRTINTSFEVGGVPTSPTSAKLSDATGTYGVKRNDTDAVVVANGTDLTETSTGVFSYSFTAIDGVAYTACVEFVYEGETIRDVVTFAATTASTGLAATVSFSDLQKRISRFAFGTRETSGLDSDKIADINACIEDGLQSVYAAYRWSFLRPLVTIDTVADTYTYDLPTGFDAIDGPLTFVSATSCYYRSVPIVHETEIRKRRQFREYTGRPVMAAIVTDTYDATVGSTRKIAFYPTPDDEYTLTSTMRLRHTIIDADNPYPIGGEVLAGVIIESCLAAAERFFEDTEAVHGAKYKELLMLAIESDKDATCPDMISPTSSRSSSTRTGIDVYINSELI